MPIFSLSEELVFPDVELATEDGILAVGGDLSPERLMLAYKRGIFPWFSEENPIIWWAPNPRFILYPNKLKISKSLRTVLNKNEFKVTYDQMFEKVIERCKRVKRKDQEDTWITDDMREAYCELHHLGFAHSVEVWKNEKLVGGLYGISLGKCFFGESMFAEVSNASKVGFAQLVQDLLKEEFVMIDCQVYTDHLASLGAELVDRKEFMHLLRSSLASPTLKGNWNEYFKTEKR